MPPRYEYGPQHGVSFGGPLTPAVKALILLNVVIYVLELFILGVGGEEMWSLTLRIFALNPALVFHGFLWQLVTYMFMHSPGSIFHILFNMLLLWMLGCELERYWGTRAFVKYYLITGVGAGVVNCAFAVITTQTIGASGAIFGIIVAYGMVFPTRRIYFWGIFPMWARQFALLLAGIELLSLGAFSADGVAHFAHLGGALTGYLYLKGWNPRRLLNDIRWRMRRRRFKTIERQDRDDRDRFYPYH